jgi:hypothetical protein
VTDFELNCRRSFWGERFSCIVRLTTGLGYDSLLQSSTIDVLSPGSAGNVPSGGMPRVAEEYKNSGNEAKKYLKTKDLIFRDVADRAFFAFQ